MDISKSEARELLRWMRNRLQRVQPNVSSGKEIRANCPLCVTRGKKADIKQKLYVSKVKSVGHCFRCGWKGTWWQLIMEVDECTLEEAMAQLQGVPLLDNYDATIASLFGQDEEEEELDDEEEEIITSEPDGFIPLSRQRDDNNFHENAAVNYLKNRGFEADFIFSGMFGTAPGEFRVYMLASPTYWQGRGILPNVKPKYTNPPYPVGDTLGLWDSLHLASWFTNLRGPVYITEGLLSGLAIIQREHPAIALLGKTANADQFQRLLSIPRPLVVMLDAEATEEGRELAWKLAEAGRPDVSLASLEAGDPADCWDYDETEITLSSYLNKRLEIVTGAFQIRNDFPKNT